MKQIIQDLKSGQTLIEDVPPPLVKPGHVLIRTTRSLVSLGTERMLVEFGKANLLQKARQQPDKVKQVLDKIKTDGLLPTLEAVFNKLGQPLPLGYCNVGTVIEVGAGVTGFSIGDRVASNGNHAEFVCVPKNLVAKIPDNVSDDAASFTVIGSIGLQGIRLLAPQLGETVVVMGLGLIGLISAQLLKASGCRVIGIDLDPAKVTLARQLGLIAVNPAVDGDPVKNIQGLTREAGCDGVLITASTPSHEVIHQACEMSRKRGRIVLVGVIGLNMRRDDFYKKELTFQVSCSYGPGRYDEEYEEKGFDYPFSYVRWTEQRNFEAVLQAIANGGINVDPLITEIVDIDQYLNIYGDMRKSGAIASILKYSETQNINRTVALPYKAGMAGNGNIGLIGAGNFASSTLIPALLKSKAKIKYIASAKGLSAKMLARKANIPFATSDYREILQDSDVKMVIVTTRHNLHASMVQEALKAQKSVFVEKPLCLTRQELTDIENLYREVSDDLTITVGFNRRFSPFAVKMRQLIGTGPCNIVATMNAGYIPPEVWVHDMKTGGGRILGEACHFIDLTSFLANSPVTEVCMNSMGTAPLENTDNVSILLKYENGTNAVINYFANGSKAYAKERVEVFSQGGVLVLDNWRKLSGFGLKSFSSMRSRMDKGHLNQFKLLCEHASQGGEALIPFESIRNTTLATLGSLESLKTRSWVKIGQ